MSTTPGNDTLIGLEGDDTLEGLGGDDLLQGRAGRTTTRCWAGRGRTRCSAKTAPTRCAAAGWTIWTAGWAMTCCSTASMTSRLTPESRTTSLAAKAIEARPPFAAQALAAGDLDTSFDAKVIKAFGSAADQLASVVIQPDGKIVAAGASNNGANHDFLVVRYNANGTLDSAFSGDDIVGPDRASSARAIGERMSARMIP